MFFFLQRELITWNDGSSYLYLPPRLRAKISSVVHSRVNIEFVYNWGERSESLPSLQRCNFVCMYPYVMDRHNDLLLELMILTDFHRCNFVCMYPYVMDRHNDLLLGLMILTDFHVDSSWNQTKKMNRDNRRKQERLARRWERERQARSQETAEKRERRLSRRRERYRAHRTEGNKSKSELKLLYL